MKKTLILAMFLGVWQAAICAAVAFDPPGERGAATNPAQHDASQTAAEASRAEEGAAHDVVDKGLRLAQRGQYDAAIKLFSKVIAHNPRFAEAYLYRGEVFDYKEEFEKAVSDFNSAINLAPTDPDGFFWRGLVLLKKRDYTHAIADFDAAISLAPDAAPAYRFRGRCWFHLGNRDKALRDANDAIRLDPRLTTAYRDRGHLRAERREYTLAIDDFTRAIALDPRDAWSADARGAVHFLLGDYEKAIADCSEAIRVNPQFADAYQNRGTAYLMSREFDASITDFTKAIELTGGKRVSPLVNRALAFTFEKQYEPAIHDFESALALAPDNQNACKILALLLAACEDAKYRDGRRAVELALKVNEVAMGNEVQSLDLLSIAYAETSDFAKAAECAEQALQFAKSLAAPTNLCKELEHRIALYRAGQPYHAKVSHWIQGYTSNTASFGLEAPTSFGSESP